MKKAILLLLGVFLCPLQAFSADFQNFGCFTIRDGKRWEQISIKGKHTDDEVLYQAERTFTRNDFPYDGVWCIHWDNKRVLRRAKNPQGEYGYDEYREEKPKRKLLSSKGFK